MFKEIENELLSIISDDPIEKIAHMPTKEIAKTMELLFKIKFEDIKRVYSENANQFVKMTIIYDSEDKVIDHDLCPINGKVYHITFFPSSLLDKDENNAITLSRAIVNYVAERVSLISDQYEPIIESTGENLFQLVIMQSIPIITCAVMRKIYSGPSLSKVIYMSLTELLKEYKHIYTEEGINTILDLFDEGLGVTDLLDNGFICSIPVNDPKYPGIWGSNSKEG